MNYENNYDVLIIGSGAAGLTAALKLAAQYRVCLLSKQELTEGATYYAQGGIAAVLDDSDSLDSHVTDTLEAGAGLCRLEAVEYTVAKGKECIDWLIGQGVHFTQADNPTQPENNLHLTREGGHSHRRIVHAADATGKAVSTTLVSLVKSHPNIDVLEHYTALDLITQNDNNTKLTRCVGLYAYYEPEKRVDSFIAPQVILATGGASKVYLYTSNPHVASGDGIAMAWRAGCRVANMEFNQFHPTCLYHPEARSFLLTEAIRGEGGKLLLPDGSEFMSRFHPQAELAPRDIVARAIDYEMKRLGVPHLYLDISHKSEPFICSHFPMIYERCLELGIDMTRDPLPIVPAAHYTCGGIITDDNAQTDITGLYAIGETAFTGLHGANRMASNSLLECLVYADAVSQYITTQEPPVVSPTLIRPWDESQVIDSDEAIVVSHNWEELRRFMWNYVGIVRSTKRLTRAERRIAMLKAEIHEYYSHFKVTKDLIELRNLVQVAELIVKSALARKESRGLHYTLDYPRPSQGPTQNTILKPETYV